MTESEKTVAADCDTVTQACFILRWQLPLTISAAKSNTDFRDIIRDSAFRHGSDRYGAAVGDIAKSKARDLARGLGRLYAMCPVV